MLIKKGFENGHKQVTREDDDTKMLMDIDAYKMEGGKTLHLCEDNKEIAVLLMEGSAEFLYEGQKKTAHRDTCLNPNAVCLHVCKGKQIEITALDGCELFVLKATNEKDFSSVYYEGEKIQSVVTGETNWEGCAKRKVVTIIDDSVAPYSNLVLGEIISFGGRWSSYTPHSHPHPEVYYYKFQRPEGFGAGFIGDDVYKIVDGSALCVPGDKTHPQVTAPGYDLYYIWAIRHLDGNRWLKTRVEDERYSWLNAEKL